MSPASFFAGSSCPKCMPCIRSSALAKRRTRSKRASTSARSSFPSHRRTHVALQQPTTRKRYTGYRSFQYLEAGTDYREFKLAKEVNRVPSSKVEVSAEQEARAQRLLDECLVISLHDHAFVVPENTEEIFEYR